MCVCKCIHVYVYMCAYVCIYIYISFTSYLTLYIQKQSRSLFMYFCAMTPTAAGIQLLLQLWFLGFFFFKFLNYFNLNVTFKKSFKIIILEILNQISLSRQ